MFLSTLEAVLIANQLIWATEESPSHPRLPVALLGLDPTLAFSLASSWDGPILYQPLWLRFLDTLSGN